MGDRDLYRFIELECYIVIYNCEIDPHFVHTKTLFIGGIHVIFI